MTRHSDRFALGEAVVVLLIVVFVIIIIVIVISIDIIITVRFSEGLRRRPPCGINKTMKHDLCVSMCSLMVLSLESDERLRGCVLVIGLFRSDVV